MGLWKSQKLQEQNNLYPHTGYCNKGLFIQDTSFVETVEMQFEFSEDLVTITSRIFENGVPKTPVVKSGYYSIGETKGKR
jgi:hypothetical protein